MKQRIYNHKISFKNRNYASNTSLSSYIWHLKDTNISPTITWEILKQAPAYNKTLKKWLLCLHEKLAIITCPSQNTLLNKKSEILSKCRHENKHFTHTLIHTHNPSNTSSIYINKTKNLKHRKYHFPPPTITLATQYMCHLSPLTPILLSTHLYYRLILLFMRIKNRPQHSTFILSTTYTLPFSTIVYISHNINTKHITIKNNHPNCPTITNTPQTRHLFS